MRVSRLAYVVTVLLLSATASAQTKAPGFNADGSVTSPAVTVPYSDVASPQARAFFPKMLAAGSKAPPITAPIEQSRAFYDRMNSDRAARMQKLYPVTIHHEAIAGVGTVTRTEHAIVGEVYQSDSAPRIAHGRIACIAHHWSQHADQLTDVVWHVRYDDDYRLTDAGWRIDRRALTINAIETRRVRRLRSAEPSE